MAKKADPLNGLPSAKALAQIPGIDPYLVWARLSKCQGYADGKVQVTVETGNGAKPWTPAKPGAQGKNPKYDPIWICKTAGGANVFTGTLEASSTLIKLVADAKAQGNWKIEFNQARYNDGGVFGNAAEDFVRRPAIGKHVVAIIDHGCPFAHQQVLKKDGKKWKSRVKALWDQDINKTVKFDRNLNSPNTRALFKQWSGVREFLYGRELVESSISAFIEAHTNTHSEVDEAAVYADADYDTLQSRWSHGAAVIDLAAGRVNPMTQAEDAVSDADIIFVQLPRDTVADTSGGSMTKYVLDGLKYIFKLAKDAEHLVINLSYGASAGPHDGSTMLERAVDAMIVAERSRRNPNGSGSRTVELVLPAGNHFLAQGHSKQTVSKNESASLQWQLMPDDRTDNFLELWCKEGDALTVTLTSPNGDRFTIQGVGSCKSIQVDGNTVGGIIRQSSTPIGAGQVVLLALGPTHRDSWAKLPHGLWTVEIASTTEQEIDVHAWVERDDALVAGWCQPQSFLVDTRPTVREQDDDDDDADTVHRRSTGSSLSNGTTPVVAGAYVQSNGELSDYTSAGESLNASLTCWPTCTAPGDESRSLPGLLVAGTRSGTLVRMNGTSVAVPQIARALLASRVQNIVVPPLPSNAPVAGMPAARGGSRRLVYP